MTTHNSPHWTEDPNGTFHYSEWTLVLCLDCTHRVYADNRLCRESGDPRP